MITATEARALAGPAPEEYLAFIESQIREAAKGKQREVIIRSEPYASWLYGRNLTDAAYKVIEELKHKGFEVSLHYQELQFVDMGLKIEW